MTYDEVKKYKIPDHPGVYLFKKDGEIIYIGKATSLRDRIRSYFSNDLMITRGSRIVDMVTIANDLLYYKTDSVLEALILESNLIKKHFPKYNIKEKDDRSYNHVVITKEDYPRVLIVRGKDIKNESGILSNIKIGKIFGPYPNGAQLKEAMKIIKKLFPHFDTKKEINIQDKIYSKNQALNIQINKYPDIFSGKVGKDEYRESIKNISLLLAGKKKTIIKNLQKKMSEFSNIMEFEKAEKIKRTIFALNHIKDVSLIKQENIDENLEPITYRNLLVKGRIESYDVAHFSGKNTVGVMAVLEDGELKKSDYRKFIIRTAKSGDDYGALSEILKRRFAHKEWPLPEILVVDGGLGQLGAATKMVKESVSDDSFKQMIIVAVVKDKNHKAREILNGNDLTNKQKSLILKLNQDTHRFAINFHRQKRKMIK